MLVRDLLRDRELATDTTPIVVIHDVNEELTLMHKGYWFSDNILKTKNMIVHAYHIADTSSHTLIIEAHV